MLGWFIAGWVAKGFASGDYGFELGPRVPTYRDYGFGSQAEMDYALETARKGQLRAIEDAKAGRNNPLASFSNYYMGVGG